MKQQLVVLALLATALAFNGCKKEEGPVGPAGPQGASGALYYEDGFINGTITGTRQDSTPFTEAFSYTGYDVVPGIYNFPGSSWTIERHSGLVNWCSFNITTASLTDSSGFLSSSNFTFQKNISATKVFLFTIDAGTSGSVTNFVYNTTTGVVSGNYSLTLSGTENSTGNAATVTGSFRASTKQLVQRQMRN